MNHWTLSQQKQFEYIYTHTKKEQTLLNSNLVTLQFYWIIWPNNLDK